MKKKMDNLDDTQQNEEMDKETEEVEQLCSKRFMKPM